MSVSEEAVIEAVEVANQYELASLQESTGDDEGPSVADRTGEEDPALELLEDRGELSWALEQLTPRQRVIIALRYFHDMSQQQVADRLGISQMHVSRLQRKAIEQLREIMSGGQAK